MVFFSSSSHPNRTLFVLGLGGSLCLHGIELLGILRNVFNSVPWK